MRNILTLFFLSVFSLVYGGEGFLGKSGQFGVNINEMINSQRINIFYEHFSSRRTGIAGSLSFTNSAFSPSVVIADVDGFEFVFRYLRANSFENRMLPVGLTASFGMGIANYTIEETINNVTTKTNVAYGMYEMALKKTHHIYQSFNLFYGISLKYTVVLSGDPEKKRFASYPPSGLGTDVSAVSSGPGLSLNLYFNYGINFML